MKRAITSYGLVFLCLIGVPLGSGGCFLNEVFEDLDQMAEQVMKGSRSILVYDGRYLVEWDKPLWAEPPDDFEPPEKKAYLESFDSWLASSRPIAELREELTKHRREDPIAEQREELTVQTDHVPVVCLVITPIGEVNKQEIEKVRMIVDECGYTTGTGAIGADSAWWND